MVMTMGNETKMMMENETKKMVMTMGNEMKIMMANEKDDKK